jgi:hypothetical protein
VLTEPQWAYIFETVGKRAVYIDENYLNEPDSERKYEIAKSILNNNDVSHLAHDEHIDYIVSEERIEASCVNTVYTEGVYIGRVLCE